MSDTLEQFTAALFLPDDVIEVRLLPSGQSFWPKASALPTLAGQLATLNATQNVFVGGNPRNKFGGRIAADVAVARSVFVDFDNVGIDDARQRIKAAGLPSPTVIVNSGHGAHAYFRLAEPMMDLAKWTDLQKSLIGRLNSDKSIHDAPRIMRLPGFTNLKPPASPCELVQCEPSRRYALADLSPGNLIGLVHDPVGDNRADRCRAYLAKLPDSIAGNRGSDRMLEACCSARRFGLDDAETWDVIQWFNATKCQPAWSEKELRHKIESAKKLVASHEVGSKLDEQPATTSPKFNVPTAAGIKPDELEVFDMADVVVRDVPWLWKGRITLGGMTIIAGSPSAGKGTLTSDLAARITRGNAWPDGSSGLSPGSVIFISGEDEPAFTLKPRLMAAGADLSPGKVKAAKTIKVYRGDGSVRIRGFNVADIPPLERLLHQTPNCLAVFIDPIGDFLDGAINSDKDNHVREVLQPLDLLAKNFNVAMVLVCHTRKASSAKADDLILGSRAFSGMPRNVWHVCKSENDDQRFFLSGKSNLAKQMDGLSFVVEGVAVDGCKEKFGAVKWSPELVPMNASQWIAEQAGDGQTGPRPEKRKEAEAFIRSLLDEHIVIASAEVDRLAEEQGIKRDTLRSAKKRLRVGCFRDGEGRSAPWFIYADQRPIIKRLIEAADQRREGPTLSQQVNAIIAATSTN